MHKEGDGEQELKRFYFEVQSLVEDSFADPMAEGMLPCEIGRAHV